MSSKAIAAAIERREARKQNKVDSEPRLPSRTRSNREAPRDPDRLTQPTLAFQSFRISKTQRETIDLHRAAKNAHSSHVAGGEAAVQARGKSFGHLSIQPRAVPSWRKQL